MYTGVGLVVLVGGDELVGDPAEGCDKRSASPPSPLFASSPSSPTSSSMRMTSSSRSSREEVGGGVCGIGKWGVEGGVDAPLWLGETCLGDGSEGVVERSWVRIFCV